MAVAAVEPTGLRFLVSGEDAGPTAALVAGQPRTREAAETEDAVKYSDVPGIVLHRRDMNMEEHAAAQYATLGFLSCISRLALADKPRDSVRRDACPAASLDRYGGAGLCGTPLL